MGKLIEAGSRVLRRRWKPLAAAAALFGIVGLIISEITSVHFSSVLNALVVTDPLTGAPIFSATDADVQRLLWASLVNIAGSLIAGACLSVFAIVAALYVERAYHGGSITLGDAIAHAVRRAPVALAAWLLTILTLIAVVAAVVAVAIIAISVFPSDPATGGGIGVLLALIAAVAGLVAAVTVGVRWSVASAVVALEPVGPVQALRRAWRLSGDNTWRAFGLQFLVVFVVSIVVALVSSILSVLVLLFIGGSALQLGIQVGLSVVISVLTAPILPVMLTLLYFDLRVRRDPPEPLPVPPI